MEIEIIVSNFDSKKNGQSLNYQRVKQSPLLPKWTQTQDQPKSAINDPVISRLNFSQKLTAAIPRALFTRRPRVTVRMTHSNMSKAI